MERALLIGAIACAIICLVPHLEFAGAISLRGISCVIIGIQTLHSLRNQEGKGTILLQVMRTASVVLGLAGVATRINLLVISSIGVDIAFQAIQAGLGSHKKDIYQSLSHASFIVINTFALIGVITGACPYIVTASTLNSVVLFAFAAKAIVTRVINKDPTAAIDAACYIALGGISIASAIRCAEITDTIPKKHHYFYNNGSDKVVIIYDRHGNIIVEVKPGEAVRFSLDPKDTYRYGRLDIDENCLRNNHLHVLRPDSTEYSTIVVQHPMTTPQFTRLPIGSSTIAIEEPRLKTEAAYSEINSAQLDAFLAPVEGPLQPCFLLNSNRPKLILKRKNSLDSYELDLESVCASFNFLKGWLRIQSGGKAEKEIFESDEEIELDCSKQVFESLMQFFRHGTLEGLERLEEKELLDLHECADYLHINRLRLLCQREIARRLKRVEWRETSLFRPYIHEIRTLSPLISLFNFH